MQRLDTMQESALSETFQAGYAEARKLIGQADFGGAVNRLDRSHPESGHEAWVWTDLMVALLFVQGNYPRCHGILLEYDSRFPGDHRVENALTLLRARYL